MSATLWTTPGLLSPLFVKGWKWPSCRKETGFESWGKLFLPACESEQLFFSPQIQTTVHTCICVCLSYVCKICTSAVPCSCVYMGVYYEQCVHVSAVSAMFPTAACTYYVASSVQISYMQQMPVCTYICLYVYIRIRIHIHNERIMWCASLIYAAEA